MRAVHQDPEPKKPFFGAGKNGKKQHLDIKSTSLARNSRRNARQLPTRQMNRGR